MASVPCSPLRVDAGWRIEPVNARTSAARAVDREKL
jgi:hypothetical protein